MLTLSQKNLNVTKMPFSTLNFNYF